MKKYFSIKKPLKVLLDIIYWVSLCALILVILCALILVIHRPASIPYISFASIGFTISELILLTLIVNELRNIMYRIIKSTPFTLENVRGFRKISLYVIIAGVMYLINSIIFNNFNILKFDDMTGLSNIDIISFLIVAGTVAVIAEVLEKAVQLKEENDLTI